MEHVGTKESRWGVFGHAKQVHSQSCHWHATRFIASMIARDIRVKTKRSSGRRTVSARSNRFQHTAEPQNHPIFGLPDSYQAWLTDSAAKEIGTFYCA